eukprot:scaffold27389_cov22-Tisochrysis_lutea.AAC.2
MDSSGWCQYGHGQQNGGNYMMNSQAYSIQRSSTQHSQAFPPSCVTPECSMDCSMVHTQMKGMRESAAWMRP